jgi:ABC-type multidrug transport system fused ATPase/permease subunit
MRFYTPTQGHISLDNVDIATIAVDEFRQYLSVVNQDTRLFNESIAYNIAYGVNEAKLTDIIAAAKLAHIHDMIMSLPQGYQTVVGEKGALLSGGQRQRICIARALIREPKVLLLDEPTSSLDGITEEALKETLSTLRGKTTTVIITHRLNLMDIADRVFRLKAGKLVEIVSTKSTQVTDSLTLFATH